MEKTTYTSITKGDLNILETQMVELFGCTKFWRGDDGKLFAEGGGDTWSGGESDFNYGLRIANNLGFRQYQGSKNDRETQLGFVQKFSVGSVWADFKQTKGCKEMGYHIYLRIFCG